MNEKFRRGGIVSIPPFGYTARDGQFIIVPEQACWVRRIFDSYLNGISIPSIAKELQTAGVRTIRGNPFDGRSVRYILGNPVYTPGKCAVIWSTTLFLPLYHLTDFIWIDHMTCVVGTHPPIISHKIFLQTQTLLMRTKKNHNLQIMFRLRQDRTFFNGPVFADSCYLQCLHEDFSLIIFSLVVFFLTNIS